MVVPGKRESTKGSTNVWGPPMSLGAWRIKAYEVEEFVLLVGASQADTWALGPWLSLLPWYLENTLLSSYLRECIVLCYRCKRASLHVLYILQAPNSKWYVMECSRRPFDCNGKAHTCMLHNSSMHAGLVIYTMGPSNNVTPNAGKEPNFSPANALGFWF
jgi:hypothetical protein